MSGSALSVPLEIAVAAAKSRRSEAALGNEGRGDGVAVAEGQQMLIHHGVVRPNLLAAPA